MTHDADERCTVLRHHDQSDAPYLARDHHPTPPTLLVTNPTPPILLLPPPEVNRTPRADVISAWAGIRPLAADPTADPESTENILRDHVVVDEGDGMVTVTGGKWTTYRLMAEHAVDAAIKAADKVKAADKAVGREDGRHGGGGGGGDAARDTQLERAKKTTLAAKATPCRTAAVAVIGAHGYSPDLAARLTQSQHRSGGGGGISQGIHASSSLSSSNSSSISSSNSSDGGGETAVMVGALPLTYSTTETKNV